MTTTAPRKKPAVLEEETRTWLARRDELLRQAPGKFVVIQGERVFGVFDDEKEAFAQAYRQLGLTRFLVREIMPGEKTYYVSGSALGLSEREETDAPPDDPGQ